MTGLDLVDHQKHLHIQIIACDIVQPVSNENVIYCVVPENIHTPPTEGIFPMTPHPLWIFQKSAHKTDTPSPPEIPFLSYTPWKYYHSLWKPKIRYFFSARYRILTLTVFFPEKFGGYCDRHTARRYVTYIKDAYHGICDTQIMDLIP